MITKIEYKTYEEFLKARENTIGASDVPIILGLNPYTTPYAFWKKKKSDSYVDEEKISSASIRGQLAEDMNTRLFEIESGLKSIKNTAGYIIFKNDKYPLFHASPDREFFKDNRKKRPIGELKDTLSFINFDENDFPQHWYIQALMQLGIGEFDINYLICNDASKSIKYKGITFDEQLFNRCIIYCSEWWEKYIIGNNEPELTEVSDIALKFDVIDNQKEMSPTDEIINLVKEIKSKKAQFKEYETEIKSLEDKLKMFMSDSSILKREDEVIATWKSNNVKRVNTKALKEQFPDIWEKVIKTNVERKLLIK